ncbi:MAG: hypothetical protein ABSA52_24500 [Candidatus Binatia bacterium]
MQRARARACASVFAGLLMLSATACTRPGANDRRADFFPLHQDDTWIYAVDRPLRNAHTRMTVRVLGERYVESLRRRCSLVDESYAANDNEIEAPSGKPEIHPIAYYRENGFLYRALSLEYRGREVHDVGLGSGEERFLPDVLDRDLSWDSTTTAYDLGGGNSYGVRQTHRAVSEPSVIQVPAGRFTGCIRVDTVAVHGGKHDGEYDTHPIVLYYADWYAPNVGLIRTIESDRPDVSVPANGPPLSQIELLAYDVEGAKSIR